MAGPSVAVRIIGDLTKWAESVSGAASSAATGTSRIKNAFGSVFDTLNKTGVLGPFQGVLDGVSSAMDSMSQKMGSAGEKLLGAGGAIAGIGVGLMSFGSAQKEAQQQLQVAIENTGASYDTYSSKVAGAVKAEERHGETANQTMNALQTLTQVTHDPQKALDDLAVASDLAAAKHEDLTTAATQLGKAYNGNAKTLKEFGITTKTSGTDAVAALSAVVKGQGEAAADSFNGKLRDLKATVVDNVATFANQYGPAITAFGAGMAGLGATMEVAKGVQEAFKDSTLLAKAATELQTIAQGALNVVMDANPIMLVVLALAAITAAFILAYQHITVFREGVQALWTGVKTAFDAIEGVISAVVTWLEKNWPLVLGILAGPFGALLAEVVTHWNAVETFLKGIPGKIAAIFSGAGKWLEQAGADIIKGLTNGIKAAATDAVDAVKNVGKDIVNGAKSLLHIGSPSTLFEGFGRDTIAGLVQGLQGGALDAASAMTSVMGGVTAAGVPPTSVAATAGGPLVTFGDVTIHDAVDLDLVAQKVSGALVAGRV